MGKEDVCLERSGDFLVIGKLLAVIHRDRVNHFFKRLHQGRGGVARLLGCLPGKFGDQGEARFALHQRNQRAALLTADDSVALPVTQTASLVHDRRTLIDAYPAFQLFPTVPARGVALPVGLLSAQVSVQIAALSLVGVEVKVDPLDADLDTLLFKDPGRSLLGTQVKPDESGHMLPVLIGDSVAYGGLTPLLGKPLRLGGAVSFLAAVSIDLAADGRSVPVRLLSYLAEDISCFQKSANLVSFFLGELRVTSHSAPLLSRLEALMLSQLASFKRPRVALGS